MGDDHHPLCWRRASLGGTPLPAGRDVRDAPKASAADGQHHLMHLLEGGAGVQLALDAQEAPWRHVACSQRVGRSRMHDMHHLHY